MVGLASLNPPYGSFRRGDADILFSALRALAMQPVLQAVKIEEHHRRGVKREQLAERKPAHHGIAKRLAQLRAGAVAERERPATDMTARVQARRHAQLRSRASTAHPDVMQLTTVP